MKVRFKHTALATVFAGISSVSLAQNPPSGWNLIPSASTSNVKIYQKGTAKVYAQVIDTVGGAKIEMKQIYTSTIGGWKHYKSDTIDNWYNGAGNPVSVVNGDYFNPTKSPTTLSFAVRANGALVEVGGDPTNDRQIEFFTGQGAMVIAASAPRMANGTTAQHAIGGFSSSRALKAGENIGRTGLCTLSPSSPSRYVLILSHAAAKQSVVSTDFAAWKCNPGSDIIMDGSASAQLRANGVSMYGFDSGGQTKRSVPQVIVIRNN